MTSRLLKFTLIPAINLSYVTWGLFLSYVFLLLFFAEVDVYHHYFFSASGLVTFYNLARLFYIVVFMWLMYAVGDKFLSYQAGESYTNNMSLKNTLLAFFSGVGIWEIFLLMVGFAGLYNYTFLSGLSLLVFAFSLPRLETWVNYAKPKIYLPGILLLSIALFGFIITKGLYPAGGHDYYLHYFPFYRKVVETGSIWPNEVWYHFYYSKGLGLFFLSMILTDPLGPQLATSAMIFAAAAMVFLILRRHSPWNMMPWFGAAFYIAFLIYTPGPHVNLQEGGWGDLEKNHELTAVLILAMIWMTILLKEGPNRVVGWTLLLASSAAVIISQPLVMIIGAYHLLMLFYFFLNKNQTALKWMLASLLAAGLVFLSLILINYVITGLPEDQNLLLYWPWINFTKLDQWGALFDALMLHHDRTSLVNNKIPLSFNFIPDVMTYLRFDVWGLLFLISFSVFSFNVYKKSTRSVMLEALDKTAILACGSFLLLIAGLSLFIGRDQPISFYRFTSFTYAPMLCLCLLILSPSLKNAKDFMRLALIVSFVFVWCYKDPFHLYKRILRKTAVVQALIVGCQRVHGAYHFVSLRKILVSGGRFILGRFSLANAYQYQHGWPGRTVWGGIYPPTEIIYKLLPPKTRIWSFNFLSYCMLPDCYMENYPSFIITKHNYTIYYGDPENAKAILQREKLNYFFYVKNLHLKDPLPLSPLFSPDNIAKYLGVAWTDGENYLLTWKENTKLALDESFIASYTKSSAPMQSFPYKAIQQILDKFNRNQGHIQNSDLPWYT